MSGVTSSPPGNDDIKSSVNLAGQKADDGTQDVIASMTVQDGELYEVLDYYGKIVTGIGTSGTDFAFNAQVVGPNGNVRVDTEVINAYGSAGDSNSGEVTEFAYPGETIRVYEKYDSDPGGELYGTLFIVKRL